MYKDSYSVKHNLRALFVQRYERYLPTAFDESMSLLEKMNKLIQSQNELIEALNAHTEHTSDQIERAFDIIDTNLDFQLKDFRDQLEEERKNYEEIRDKIHSDLLPDSVNQKLEEWLLNGTVKDLITDTVFPDFISRMTELENRMEEMELLEEVSLNDFYYMAEENTDGSLDWTNAMTHAASVSKYVVVPEGDYDLDPTALSPNHSGLTISGRGDATRLNIKSGSDVFKIQGSEESFKRVTQDYERGSRDIYLENTDGLSAGDDILLQSQKNALDATDAGGEWVLGIGTGDNPQRVPFAEFGIIESVQSDYITLVSIPIYPFYNSTNDGETRPVQDYSTVKKVNFAKNIKLENFTVGEIPSGFALRTKYAKDVVIENVTFIDSNETTSARGMTNFQLSYGCEAKGCTYIAPRDLGFGDTDYWQQNPYKIVSCQNTGIVQCVGENAAQMVDLSFLTGYMPNTGCYIKGCRSINASRSAFTTHGGNYLLQFIGNYSEGSRQGFSHRGRAAVISNNVLIGSSFSSTDTILWSGISLYQQGAVDNIITNNAIRNFSNGISYSDSGSSRAEYLNTLISNNTIDNCSRSILLYRYQTGRDSVPKTELGVTISDNHIKMRNNTDSSPVFAIFVNERNDGVVIKGNTIKGIEGEMVGFTGDRTNNFYGINILGNVDKVKVYDNVFYDIDRAIQHLGTSDVQTPNLYPNGVEFYEKNNQLIRVRLSNNYASGIIPESNIFMTARASLDSIDRSRQQIGYYGIEGLDLRNSGNVREMTLTPGLWDFSWKFSMFGLVGRDGEAVVRITLNGDTIINTTVRENEAHNMSTRFVAESGDVFAMDVHNTQDGLVTGFNVGVGDNKFTLINLSSL